jgi:crotonobetainyl-CoA:carnitine CoA-transferase CaiB-like acyl-CoA transferase
MGPLRGYRVIELGIWVAGPAAASMLADWGADVIKIESPAGDPNRHALRHIGVDNVSSPAFALDNRGKRGVVLDLKTEPGRQALGTLLDGADVFVTNLRPRALERLGLDPATLRERYPRLVVATLTSFGWLGPDRDRAGYDVSAFWARSGMAARMLPAGSPPPPPRPAVGDRMAATALVAGITAALLDRVRTGHGDVVDVSLLRTGLYCNGSDLSIQQAFGKRARTRPREDYESPLYNCYRTADGRWLWLVALEGDRHWPGLAAALGRPGLADDPRFAGRQDRRANGRALIGELDAIFAARTLQQWSRALDEADVWWGPVLDLDEAAADPQAAATGAWVDIAGERSVATPVRFWQAGTSQQRAAPAFGEHTAEVLGREAAYPAAER